MKYHTQAPAHCQSTQLFTPLHLVTPLHHLAILILHSNTSCTLSSANIQNLFKWNEWWNFSNTTKIRKKKKKKCCETSWACMFLNMTLFDRFLDLYTLHQIQAFFARELYTTLNWFYEKPASHSPSFQLPVWLPLPWPWAAVLLGKAAGGPPWCFSSPPAECPHGDGPSETQSLLQYGPWDYFQKQSAGSQ